MRTNTQSERQNDDRIHLAIAVDDLASDYNQHAGTTIASFLDNCQSQQVVIHLLYSYTSGEASANKKKYQTLCERWGAELFYYHVQLPEWINDVPAIKTFSTGALLRLYLPSLLTDVKKIIYLDCDVVVNTDVTYLWNIDLSSYPLAASYDTGVSCCNIRDDEYCNKLNTSRDRYFCSGVMVLNLQYIRENFDFLTEFVEYLKNNKNVAFLDQDILNYFFGKTYYQLEEKYSLIIAFCSDPLNKLDSIIHYCGRPKPWEAYLGKMDDPYWYYLQQTPWKKDTSEFVFHPCEIPNIEYINEYGFGQLYDKLGKSYTQTIKIILQSIISLTKKRIGDFKRHHL